MGHSRGFRPPRPAQRPGEACHRRGSRNALPSSAWQDTIRRPLSSDSNSFGDFIQSPYRQRKHANNGLPRLRRMESQNQDLAVRTGHLLLNSSCCLGPECRASLRKPCRVWLTPSTRRKPLNRAYSSCPGIGKPESSQPRVKRLPFGGGRAKKERGAMRSCKRLLHT